MSTNTVQKKFGRSDMGEFVMHDAAPEFVGGNRSIETKLANGFSHTEIANMPSNGFSAAVTASRNTNKELAI